MTTAIVTSASAKDYSLTGVNAARAIERGLAEAEWYTCDIPRETLRALLTRRNGPAIRDTLIWFALITVSAGAAWMSWGSWWALIPFAIYGALYASTSDSRWHESSHGTAFRSDWMNNALYEIASFMVMREATPWRWSHNRHHSDTIIVGRDPEIAVPRPPSFVRLIASACGLGVYPKYFQHILVHAAGYMYREETTYIPASEFPAVYARARIYVLIYAAVIAAAVWYGSILPLMFIGLPHLYGSWLMLIYGLTQHAGLAEDVLDHRLNCRTVHMNLINRYLYWNMGYHVEHHMFPLVPYHALPRLHAAIKADCPPAYPGLISAYREIIPALWRQVSDATYCVPCILPVPALPSVTPGISAPGLQADAEGWICVGAAAELRASDVRRFDHGKKTFALIRDAAGRLQATDGICTHGNTHLAEGLVKDGVIECPKHNGRFRLEDGAPARAPICRGLATYPLEDRGGQLFLNLLRPGGAGARLPRTVQLRVVSNHNLASFIKELVLEPLDAAERIAFAPGDYLQLHIPAYDEIRFRDLDIQEPFARSWRENGLYDLVARNPGSSRLNNYSLASNTALERTLRFNVRIALPPPGQDVPPGVGSSYVFRLAAGDIVTATGPFGDFHIKPTQREMVYIGGGAGMAPLRAHLSHLFETAKTSRTVSFWYGARSRQELFYQDYFRDIAKAHANFRFQAALSSPLPDDAWTGPVGLIHEVVLAQHLRQHQQLNAIEFYLCGPPAMITACTALLSTLGVPADHIAYDEF